jgi:hypothetical protein
MAYGVLLRVTTTVVHLQQGGSAQYTISARIFPQIGIGANGHLSCLCSITLVISSVLFCAGNRMLRMV